MLLQQASMPDRSLAPTGWSNLPADLLGEIFSRLDPSTLLKVAKVCTRWRAAAFGAQMQASFSQKLPQMPMWGMAKTYIEEFAKYAYSLENVKTDLLYLSLLNQKSQTKFIPQLRPEREIGLRYLPESVPAILPDP